MASEAAILNLKEGILWLNLEQNVALAKYPNGLGMPMFNFVLNLRPLASEAAVCNLENSTIWVLINMY